MEQMMGPYFPMMSIAFIAGVVMKGLGQFKRDSKRPTKQGRGSAPLRISHVIFAPLGI
jgi:hypothetical protein